MSAIDRFPCGCLLALSFLLAAGESSGQGRVLPRPEVRGIVKKVDPAAGTITLGVSDGRQEAQDKTYPLAQEVEVAVTSGVGFRGPFAEGKLADLSAGALVTLALSADSQKVESILAEGPQARGQLKRVDVAKGAVTVSVFPAPGGRGQSNTEEKTFALAADADVGIDDGRGRRYSIKEGKLADLAANALVVLRLSPDQKTVHSIVAEGPTLTGIVKSLDAGSGSLTLLLGGAREAQAGEERTLKVSGAVVLTDDGRGRRLSLREGKLADVPVGAAANVKLSVDQQSIALLRAEGPSVPAMIRSVDHGQGTITFSRPVRGEAPEEKTLPVAADARIVVDGSEKKLADFRVSDGGQFGMLRLSLDQKTIQGLQVAAGR